MDVRLPRVPAYCIRGEVRDGKGRPVEQVALSIGQRWWSTGVFSQNGRFLIPHLVPGTYELVVTSRPGPGGRILARRRITIGNANVIGLLISIPGDILEHPPSAR